ncbi:hypothetical protein JQS43_24130 [Natronosporangium hydrolyticum]|uniref:Uncharacterized protein n=1 Tax=Natronosporangium hydrolyticum TaxID=2811111 RepID=A0A895YKA1_9ACTN|nr:hypothetical protein [Natronosporangium hydrolyticum]QSB14530.1 hypothetical protein JQS43_24130 [Natronosporangium hydrolyticum]
MTQLEVDPDPTPTATPWEEYLAAAQSLDAIRRDAANAPADPSYALSAARAELDQVRRRIELQRARLVGEAVRAGLPAPQLLPAPAEQAAAAMTIGHDPLSLLPVLRHSHGLLDACDAQLNAAPPLPRRRRPGSLVAVALLGATLLLTCFGLVLLWLVVQ